MVTKVVDRPSMTIPWDHFLKEKEGGLTERAATSLRQQVEGFRRREWPAIKRYLARDFSREVDVEPHWVSAGKAIYWQDQVLRQRVEQEVDGEIQRSIEEVRLGWRPSGPLPANNPYQIDHYLGKGFRLRPPSEGVEEEVLEEAAVPSEGFKVEPDGTENRFFCQRHSKGKVGFPTWKAYVNHCAYYREPPTEDPPPEIAQVMAGFKYYCFLHNRGFQKMKAASFHRKTMQRRTGTHHPTIEQMKVNKDA